jgi:nitroimidazol reductase NimA-like FMN-containing flavoprotein (pyridoxamine 5'-phosphate oxidase superfamily)
VPTTDSDRRHEPLGREDCLQLLATTGIGRLAYTQGALPAVRPVSFTLRGDEVLIPVLLDSPLLGAVRGAVVAFEADDYDEGTRTGWTVTVLGPSRVLDGRQQELPRADAGLIAVSTAAGLVRGWWTCAPAAPCTR